MQRRHELANIPIELVRTLIVVAETRSYSETGKRLALTQPAITAQIKRLQTILGETVFRASRAGIEITPFGASILNAARRLIEANDEILAASRGTRATQLRLGISSLYAADFYAACHAFGSLDDVAIKISHSDELDRLFLDQQLDVVCSLQPSEVERAAALWQEDLVWVKASDFQPKVGTPLPIVALQGARPDAPVIDALVQRGLTYRIVVASAELRTRMEAVAAGIGYAALPERFIKPPLLRATEDFLPPIEPIIGAIRTRSPDIARLDQILKLLTTNKPPIRRHEDSTPTE